MPRRCLHAAAAIALAALVGSAGRAQDGALSWTELKGRHFIVRCAGPNALARSVLQRAEAEYDRIASELGYVRYGGFWTWDRRVSVFVYPDRETFVQTCQAPPWAAGKADRASRSVSGYAGHRLFLDAFLPHELAHLIFRDFVGDEACVPLWLEEGVAVWAERGSRPSIEARARSLASSGRLIPLATLNEMDIRGRSDTSVV